MISPAIFAAGSALALSAGAPAPFVDSAVVAANLPAPGAAVTPAATRPAVARKAGRTGLAARRTALLPPRLEAVEAARHAALREPSREAYAGAVQVYPWSEGALFRLYAAPGQVSDIALQPGESLVSVASGDTARWVIGDTVSGAGATRRTHVLVKPASAGLDTNLVIATDRRIYHVELESDPKAAMAGIAWTYPDDPLVALRAQQTADATVAPEVPVEALDFGYRIEGDRPAWRPLRAFDDGRQVFIEFPPTLGRGEAPPLFVIGDGGRAELVNYRIRGHYYVVDRLFAAAELRLGQGRQQVVRIVRDDPGRASGS